MRRCAHCHQLKEEEEFAWSNRRLGKRQKHCRDCMSVFNKASYAKKGDKEKRQIYENRVKRQTDAKQFVWDYLTAHPCVDCGETDPVILQFDHVRGKKKKDVSTMIQDGYSVEAIKEEIEKCLVRCANCHLRKTHQEKGWFRG